MEIYYQRTCGISKIASFIVCHLYIQVQVPEITFLKIPLMASIIARPKLQWSDMISSAHFFILRLLVNDIAAVQRCSLARLTNYKKRLSRYVMPWISQKRHGGKVGPSPGTSGPMRLSGPPRLLPASGTPCDSHHSLGPWKASWDHRYSSGCDSWKKISRE